MNFSFTARITKITDDIRASYWFVPTCLVLFAVALSSVSLYADRRIEHLPDILTFWTVINTQDSARAVVSVIAQSSIGVAGVLFSITMLAVSFASGQFGPRLIGGFMRDRGNQWSLGILISTFTFSLLVLRAVGAPFDGGDALIPHISMLIAVTMALWSVFVVIYHVHHVPETISISNIAARLGRRFTVEIDILTRNQPNRTVAPFGPSATVHLKTAGYVHTIATAKLADLAQENGWTIETCAMAGDFINAGHVALRVYGTDTLSDGEQDKLRKAVALGNAKTEEHNLLFIAEQLVEIVGRAMSPGVNDPFTAITCMQWLQTGLCVAAGHNAPLTRVTDAGVIADPIGFDRLLDRTLGDCAEYTLSDALTRRTLISLIAHLETRAVPAHHASIRALAARVAEDGMQA